VVAKGIEAETEAAVLRKLGGTTGQGYPFGRPDRIHRIAVDGWLGDAPGA
jgi:EAL domain-containing protein (putative c-di-GMP-specific phosphodiesterase class I)